MIVVISWVFGKRQNCCSRVEWGDDVRTVAEAYGLRETVQNVIHDTEGHTYNCYPNTHKV